MLSSPGTSGAWYPRNQELEVLDTPGTWNKQCSVPQDPGTGGARSPGYIYIGNQDLLVSFSV